MHETIDILIFQLLCVFFFTLYFILDGNCQVKYDVKSLSPNLSKDTSSTRWCFCLQDKSVELKSTPLELDKKHKKKLEVLFGVLRQLLNIFFYVYRIVSLTRSAF